MSSDERQEAIWDIILQRKFETVPNIADELGVCTRTIYGDVTKKEISNRTDFRKIWRCLSCT